MLYQFIDSIIYQQMSALLQILCKDEKSLICDHVLFERHMIDRLFARCNLETNEQYNTSGSITISKINYHHYHVFRVIEKGNTTYFVIDTKKFVGSGCFGYVYMGFDVLTKETVVAKYGDIGTNEIECLKKTGLYIASMPSIILMHKAPGKDYDQILRDPIISDQKKILIHGKIIDKYNQLLGKHNICHYDPKPEHVFVDDNVITFIDFGSSYYPTVSFFNSDISYFNMRIKTMYAKVYGKIFKKYIESLSEIDEKNMKIRSMFIRAVGLSASVAISLGIMILYKLDIIKRITRQII